ncbi:MAG: TM2 domain-containing protein [Symploca sp. SIO1C4]|uniref:TM2 domain-containing protein n=1 Tax=Symploca sp. SIO1C4 TaxID=2607765 RepID=A0A6B3N7B6_9CYAN|nr:TM2 domain-containing protein [Symploca sp. SIO1C4]
MSSQSPYVNKTLSYILWGLGCFGVCGLHRFYLGKPITGLIWFFTFGLCFIGQIIDVFLINRIIHNRNKFLEEKEQVEKILIASDTKESLLQRLLPFPVGNKKNQQMQKLLKAASDNANVLSLGQAILITGLPADQVQELLTDTLRKGIARIDNEPESGAVRYYFDI